MTNLVGAGAVEPASMLASLAHRLHWHAAGGHSLGSLKLCLNGTITMQNDTEDDVSAICAVAAQEAERIRFRDEFRALRVKLRSREFVPEPVPAPEPEHPALPSTEIFRPVPRMEAPPINIVVHQAGGSAGL